MKRNMTISLLLVLCAAFILSSCGGSGTKTDTAVKVTETAADTVETTTGELKPDLPDSNFEGYEFVILDSNASDTNGVDWVTYDVYTEEQNGDAINDAVYTRNLYLAETYNVVIKEFQGVTLTLAQKAVSSGDSIYDAVMTNFVAASTLAQNGMTYDMYDIPYIDLSQPWWDQNGVETLSIGGHMNYATGDITCIVNDATWTLMFNKQLAEDFNFDFYSLVDNDQWNFDLMYEMSTQVSADKNGDGVRKFADDQFGIIATGDIAQAFLYAGGMLIADKDADDLPALKLDVDRMATVAEKAGAYCVDKEVMVSNHLDSSISTDNLRIGFQEARALFYGECMQCIKRMRESETDFGVIPWPKFFETQDRYYSFVHSTAGKCITVPGTQTELERTGIVLEAMAAKSKYTLTVAYYDVSMTNKFIRDEESARMLDVILANRVYDLGYIYDWGGLYSGLRAVVTGNTGNFASKYESLTPAFNAAMQKTVDYFLEHNA